MADEQKPGPTGRRPMGQLDDTDDGELAIGVAYDPIDGLVKVNFATPVVWFALPKERAILLAQLLLKHAGVKEVRITF